MKRHFMVVLVLALLSGCAGNDTKTDGSLDALDADIDASGDGGADAGRDSGAVDDCTQPTAVPHCEDDWCRVEPGCFILGSPATEPCRAAYAEDQVQVALTRPFMIRRHEISQSEWEAAGFTNPSRDIDPNKPVVFVNWFEAMAYANALSEAEELEPCYDLTTCSGTIGSGCPEGYEFCYDGTVGAEDVFTCAVDPHLFEDWYACPGYRLPTSAEWEYAARAGTTTATYNGDILVATEDTNEMEPILEPIAWYRYNSGLVMHTICGKQPNGWGLYDMIGNVQEWVDYVYTGFSMAHNQGADGPLVDPIGESYDEDDRRSLKGLSHRDVACRSRSAWHFPVFFSDRSLNSGFRLIRTLPE